MITVAQKGVKLIIISMSTLDKALPTLNKETKETAVLIAYHHFSTEMFSFTVPVTLVVSPQTQFLMCMITKL